MAAAPSPWRPRTYAATKVGASSPTSCSARFSTGCDKPSSWLQFSTTACDCRAPLQPKNYSLIIYLLSHFDGTKEQRLMSIKAFLKVESTTSVW